MAETRGNGVWGHSPAGLLFLFSRGHRPSREFFLSAVGRTERLSVSYDPVAQRGVRRMQPAPFEPSNGRPDNWLELLRDGLTFDLLGLADGPPVMVPLSLRSVGCSIDPFDAAFEGVGLFSGPHLASAAASLPVVRAQLAIASELAGHFSHLSALCWTPGGCAVAPVLFSRLIDEWLKGGAFPALALMQFEEDGTGHLTSHGLAFFLGQEIRLSREMSQNRLAATRQAVRIVHQLLAIGPLEGTCVLEIDGVGTINLSLPGSGGTIMVERA